jgi:hypothetical protein
MMLSFIVAVFMTVRVHAADRYACTQSGAGMTTYCHVPSSHKG